MENKYSEIRQLTGSIISTLLEDMKGMAEKIETLETEVESLKKRIAELEEERKSGAAVREVGEPLREAEPVRAAKPELSTSAPESAVLGDMFTVPEAIADKVRDRPAWMTDFPGESVEDVNMAVSLNDKLLFIRELFDGDDEQYESIIDVVNGASSFEDVLMDMRAVFPEWDEESDTVYRFYMAVRRKFV